MWRGIKSAGYIRIMARERG